MEHHRPPKPPGWPLENAGNHGNSLLKRNHDDRPLPSTSTSSIRAVSRPSDSLEELRFGERLVPGVVVGLPGGVLNRRPRSTAVAVLTGGTSSRRSTGAVGRHRNEETAVAG